MRILADPIFGFKKALVLVGFLMMQQVAGIDWDDLDAEHSYDAMASYRQSKIALGLFGLELQRRSVAHGWGITSNIAHPGVAPTSLLAALPTGTFPGVDSHEVYAFLDGYERGSRVS